MEFVRKDMTDLLYRDLKILTYLKPIELTIELIMTFDISDGLVQNSNWRVLEIPKIERKKEKINHLIKKEKDEWRKKKKEEISIYHPHDYGLQWCSCLFILFKIYIEKIQ